MKIMKQINGIKQEHFKQTYIHMINRGRNIGGSQDPTPCPLL